MAIHATPEHHARVAALTFAGVYPHYVTKVEKKGRSEAELLEVRCCAVGRQRIPVHLAAQIVQPQREPRALEARTAGYEDATAAPERVHVAIHQIFHGALPLTQRFSSRFFSRKVSMGCQKPL